MDQELLLSQEGEILIAQINRPSKLNALNRSLISAIGDAVHKLNFEDDLKGMIITGVGEKAFVAGADISEFSSYGSEEAKNMAQKGHDVFFEIEQSNKPVIAAVNGFALGGGCELAMACHLRIASENARFGQPEATLGLIPGYGGTQRLVQLIGKGKAMEFLLTGDMLKAEEAGKLGLVNHVVPFDELMETTMTIMNKIIAKAPIAIAKTIEAVNALFEDGTNGFANEVDGFAHCFDTEDFKEGTAAFLEKRQPTFNGK